MLATTRAPWWAVSLAAVLVSLGGCSDGGGGAENSPTTLSTVTSAPGTGPSVTTATTAAGRVISAEVRNGSVVGGPRRVRVETGERIIIRVTSDTADEVHVHGYEKKVDIAAGGVVEIPLVADLEGVFEIELEERKLPILELAVQ